MSLDEIKSVVIPYINIRIIQRPILCHKLHSTHPNGIVTRVAQHARDVREWRNGVQ